MNALAVSLGAFALMLGGAAAGVALRARLPQHHLNEHTKDVIRLGAGLLATMAALVLGLLITSAKNNYDAQRDDVRQIVSKVVVVDSLLARYGPEAQAARDLQHKAIAAMVDRIWGERTIKSPTGAPHHPSPEAELVVAAIEGLSPQTDVQRNLKLRALQAMTSIMEARVLLFEQGNTGPPAPLLIVLIFWLTILFTSFTLFSPVNPTNAAALVVIALSASGAIFLILEMNSPFTGLMQIPSTGLRRALGAP